jgi:RNA polymerase sigma-70 factor (ECF subfamily)
MSAESSFDELMQHLRQGDQQAAEEVFARFVHRLIGLARAHLDSRIRRKEDADDVVQSVFASFFWRHADGQFEHLKSWNSVWSLLACITLRKCGLHFQHFHAGRRDVGREDSGTLPLDDWERSGASWEALGHDPTPSQAVVLAETVEQLLRGLQPRDREIAALLLEEYGVSEISSRVGCSERTVRRVRDRIRNDMQKTLEGV